MKTELDLELATMKAELEYLKKQNELLTHKVEIRDRFIENTEPQIDTTDVYVTITPTQYFNHHIDHDYDVCVEIEGNETNYSMLTKSEVENMIEMLEMLHTYVETSFDEEIEDEF